MKDQVEFIQIGLFSRIQLTRYYRYKNLFQILPLEFTRDQLLIDYPLILELRTSSEIIRNQDDKTFWCRDVWEKIG